MAKPANKESNQVNERITNDLYPDPQKLSEKIEEYFEDRDNKNKKYTVSGLCYFLGYSSRNALQDLKARKDPAYAWLVERAYLRMEEQKHEGLLKPGQPTAGFIFDLKNVHKDDWKDKQDEKEGGVTIIFKSGIERDNVEVEEQ